MPALAAWALSLLLPTGVGLGVRTENRAGVSNVGLGTTDSTVQSADPFAAVGADVLVEPAIRGTTKIDNLRLEGGYAPKLVFRVMSGDPRPLVLHSLAARGMGTLPRLQFYGGATADVGEVDFSRAVRELELPGSVPDGTGSLDAIPYMAFSVGGGASWRATHHWTLSLSGGGNVAGASAERLRTAFPVMTRPWIEGRTSHRLTRQDTVELATQLQTVLFSTGPSYGGVQPVLGYTHSFKGFGSFTAHAGGLFTSSTPFPGTPGVFRVHPIADVGISRTLKVHGETKAETSFMAGVSPFFDPFTATLDERSLVGLGTKVPYERFSFVTSAMWLMMLNFARPEYGYRYIGGRGQQTDHIALLDTRVEYHVSGPLRAYGGVSTLLRWDEPSFPRPKDPRLELFGQVGITADLQWPKPPDRAEEEG